MTVFDAYALIAFLAGEPAAEAVDEELRKGNVARIAAVNLAEVVDRLIRVAGHPEASVDRSLEWMLTDGLAVVPVGEPVARLGGLLRARHYHHQRAAVSLADCLALATSIELGDSLATADPALAKLARGEGVTVLALPDSQGRLP